MANKTDYLENAFLNHVFNGISYSAPAAVYIALFVSQSTDASSGQEVTGTGYIRATGSFSVATTGALSSALITFPDAGAGGWGVLTAFGIFDDPTAGNELCWNTLTAPVEVAAGDTVRFASGSLTITED